MRVTGIIRRIDDVGRVVIPKEIRRDMRIQEGDPLEVYVSDDGGVMFKKYSCGDEMTEISKAIVTASVKAGFPQLIITDREFVIASSNSSFVGHRISQELLHDIVNCPSTTETERRLPLLLNIQQVQTIVCIKS